MKPSAAQLPHREPKLDDPAPNRSSQNNPKDPYLSVAAVAKLIAVAPATLRTWDRRYGLGPTVHPSGTHRKYGSEDIMRLSIMRLWIYRGATSSQAATYAREANLTTIKEQDLRAELEAEIAKNTISMPAPPSEGGRATVTELPAIRLAPELSTTSWQNRCTELVERALRNDLAGCLRAMALQESTDLIQWWKRLVRPALERLSSHTVLANPGQSPKMLVGQVALSELSRVTVDTSGVPAGHPSKLRNMVLVFAPASGKLSLSAHVLAAALVQNEINGHLVTGPDAPDRIRELVAMTRPVAAVFIADDHAPNVELIEQLVADYPQLPIFIGLGGRDALPPRVQSAQVERVRSFTALFHEVVAVANNPAIGEGYWDEQSRTVSLEHLT